MKKLILLPVLLLSALSLASCRVNWFDQTYDVPWYWIAIPIAVIAIAGYFILMNTTFVCPYCNTLFKPKKYELSVCVHMNRCRLVRCPRCKKRGFFKRAR